MAPNMLEHALEYLERGWCVLPCKAGTKHPKVKWREYRERLPTEPEVREWWTRWPNAGIAVLTGKVSGLVVVDIDGRSGGTLDGHPITPLMSKTPDGHHLFYTSDTGIRNAVKAPGPGGPSDIRGDGGIVLLPPSRHPSGHRYAWVLQGEPNPLPEWVRKHSESSSRVQISGGTKKQPAWIEAALRGDVPKGTRNDTAARLAGYYRNLGMALPIIEAQMLSWNQLLQEPLDEREVVNTVQSIDRTAARASERDARDREQAAGAAKSDPEDEDPSTFELHPYGSYMKRHAKWETRWLFDGWLPDQTIAMLVAAPGSFKTWLEFDMAVSLAGGFPFLGQTPGRTGPVIIIQQEDSPGDIVDRIATMHFAKAGIAKPRLLKDGTVILEFPNDIPIFFHEAARLRFDNPKIMEQLRHQIETLKPVACFIDPLYSAANAEGYMAEAVQGMLPLKRWRTDYKTSFILAHHTNKSGTTVRSRQRLWGSQLLNGFLEMGLQIHRPDENAEWIVVERHSKSGGSLPAVKITYDINTGDDWRFDTEVTRLTAKQTRDLLDGDSESKGGNRSRAAAPKLSKPAQTVLNSIETAPATAADLMVQFSKTHEVIQAALAELMRTTNIVQCGDKYATVVDAAALSRN